MPLTPETPRWTEPGLLVGAPFRYVPTWAAMIFLVAGLWFVKDLGYLLTDRPGGLSILWAPSGVLLFALLVSGVGRWQAILTIGLLLGATGSLAYGRSPGTALAMNLGNVVEAGVGAWVARLLTPRVTVRTLRGVASLIAGPAVGKLVTVTAWRLAAVARGSPIEEPRFAIFWLGSMLGVATVGWLLVAWVEEAPREERPVAAVAETGAALLALLLSTGLMQFHGVEFANEILVLPPIIWLAVRFGPRGGSVAVCLGAVSIVYTAWRGHGVLGMHFVDSENGALATQIFLAVVAAPTAFVAAVVAERQTAEEGRILIARTVNQTTDGLGVYEADGRILWANEAAARFYGVSLRALQGRRAWELVPRGTPEKWRRRWNELLETGILVREEAMQGPDGRVTPWETSVALVEAGGRKLAVAAMRDVSDRKRAAEALRLAGIGTLAAGVAHEINNPLASVVGNLALVRERLTALRERGGGSDLARFAEEWLDPIVDAEDGARRVRDVVAELRVFARAEAGRGPVDVARAMRSALSLAQSEIQHRARLVTRIAEVPPVRGSEGRLAQAFANVLVNAARAIPEGASQENEIRVEVRAQDGFVTAEVSDSGVGMSHEVRVRIFEPFFTTRDVGEGIGLGLAVTHAIVTAMGGRIDVDSAPAAGTRFRITLPVDRAMAAALAAGEATSPSASTASPQETLRPTLAPPAAPAEPASPPAPAPPPGPTVAHPPAQPAEAGAASGRLKLLIVDDEPLVGRSLQRILSRDHDVDTVDRARAALDRIAGGERFDAVLCDLMMPDVNGMAFYDEVAILDPELQGRIVFVTGGAFTEAARDFLDRVANERLEKPVDPTTLREMVRHFTPRPAR